MLSLQGHSSFSSEKADPLFALSSQIGIQLKKELILPVASILLTKGMLKPHLVLLPDGLCAQQLKAASMNILLFASELLPKLFLCWQNVKGNLP